jgi:tetratricopeptide (TPR) repeat protein
MALSTGFLLFGLFGVRARRQQPAPKSKAKAKRGAWREHWPWILLLVWFALGLMAPVREALLGDAAIWIQGVQADTLKLSSEPLSARVLDGVADWIRAKGGTIDQASLGVVSHAAAIPAGLLFAGIALEIGGAAAWGIPLALLLTLGASQFYFGYIESYPIALVFVLLFLWLGLRAARGASAVLLAGVALAAAGTAHLATLLLYPAYAYLALREPGPLWRRALVILFPSAVLAIAFALVGYDLRNLIQPLRAATQTVNIAGTLDTFRRSYSFFSWEHANDVLNQTLLAAPVALLLLLVGSRVLPRRIKEWDPRLLFLTVAAVVGIAAACMAMTPVAPAQDWDLYAFLLVPAAVLGIGVVSLLAPELLRGVAGAAVAALSACLMLSFILVNTDSSASIRRFATVVNDAGRVSPYGRAYGNEILWVLHRSRGEREMALQFAQATLAAEPTNPRYSINLGHSLLAFRRIEEAIPHFRRAMEVAPGRWDAPYDLGLCYASVGRHAEALALFEASTRRSPEQPEVWHAIVRSLVHTGHEDSAAVVWSRVKERWPEYVEGERKKRVGP